MLVHSKLSRPFHCVLQMGANLLEDLMLGLAVQIHLGLDMPNVAVDLAHSITRLKESVGRGVKPGYRRKTDRLLQLTLASSFSRHPGLGGFLRCGRI